jgi:hypothetical protein
MFAMSLYVVTDPARPWATLFTSADLAEVAAALVAQTGPLAVYASRDGAARPLSENDQARLDAALDGSRRLQPIDVQGMTYTAVLPESAS